MKKRATKPLTITCKPLATTPEGAAAQRWPDDKARTTAMLRNAFLEGVTWQRRQYGDQRREIERLKTIEEMNASINKQDKEIYGG